MSQESSRGEGVDGTDVAFRERLYAPWPVWAVALVLTASLGVAYGYRLGLWPGLAVFLASTALVTWWLLATAPLVVVDDLVLRAGRARLPLRFVDRVAPLDPDQTRDARGRLADPAAHLCIRGWIPRSVLVEIDDPADPHPYWLISTRRGSELAPLLATARDAARAPSPRPRPTT